MDNTNLFKCEECKHYESNKCNSCYVEKLEDKLGVSIPSNYSYDYDNRALSQEKTQQKEVLSNELLKKMSEMKQSSISYDYDYDSGVLSQEETPQDYQINNKLYIVMIYNEALKKWEKSSGFYTSLSAAAAAQLMVESLFFNIATDFCKNSNPSVKIFYTTDIYNKSGMLINEDENITIEVSGGFFE